MYGKVIWHAHPGDLGDKGIRVRSSYLINSDTDIKILSQMLCPKSGAYLNIISFLLGN